MRIVQWRNQVHFTEGATRGQALFKGGQQFNDIISNDVIINSALAWITVTNNVLTESAIAAIIVVEMIVEFY